MRNVASVFMWRSGPASATSNRNAVFERHIKYSLEGAQKVHQLRLISPALARPDLIGQRACSERFRLHFQINLSVDVGRIDGCMTEPTSDRIDIHACAE